MSSHHNDNMYRHQDASIVNASRKGEPWTDADVTAVLSGKPLDEVAREIGRTYRSVVQMRVKLSRLKP